MKQIQPFQKHWLQLTCIVVCRLKGELVLTITHAGTQNEPTVALLFYSSNMNIIFCHVLYSPSISMLVNRVFEISGELRAKLMSYMTTLMSFKYLPYITVPSRITQLSTTCIDHIFVKTSHKDKVLNIMSGLFYCEITDHLPCFLSLKFEKYNRMDERPMIRIFGEKNCAFFVQKMQSYNWNEIHNDTGEEIYDKFIAAVHNIYQQAFPLVRVSRKRWRDKPWLTKALKVSIKHKNKLYREYILHPDNLH